MKNKFFIGFLAILTLNIVTWFTFFSKIFNFDVNVDDFDPND